MTDIAEPLAAADYDAPLWLQALTYPAGVDRDLIDAAFPVGGIIAPGDLAVAPRGAGANMSVDIAPGKCVVVGGDVAGQGKYVGRLKNTVNVPISAAPSSGLTRIDLIHAHVTDATVVGGTVNAMTVETPVVGTAVSSNPVAPAVPASSIPLAQIVVASGTASIVAGMITDRRTQVFPAPHTYSCRVWRNAAYTWLASSQVMPFDTVEQDTHGLYNPGNSRFTAPVAGWYSLAAQAGIASPPAGVYGSLSCYKNGGNYVAGPAQSFTGGGWPTAFVTATLYLIAGDYVDARILASASTLGGSGQTLTYATFSYLGPD